MMVVGRLRKIGHGQAMIVAVARYLLHASWPSLIVMLGHMSKASPLVAAVSLAAIMLWLLAAHLMVASLSMATILAFGGTCTSGGNSSCTCWGDSCTCWGCCCWES